MAEEKPHICYFCSMGCGLIVETEGDEATYLEHKTDDPVNGGTLCAKGNYCLEMINHPERLFAARKEGAEVPLEEIVPEVSAGLGAAAGKSALIVSGRASVEEICAASAFARECLGTDNIAVSMPTGDYELLEAFSEVQTGRALAELRDINKANNILAIGDVFSIGPCISKRFFASRYAERGNTITLIARDEGLTGKFASAKIIGNEARGILAVLKAALDAEKAKGPLADKLNGVLADKDISDIDGGAARAIAERLFDAKEAVVVFASQSPLAAKLAGVLVSLLPENKKLYVLNDYGNARNIFDVFEQKKSVRDILEGIEAGEIEALLSLGADVVASVPDMNVAGTLAKLRCLVVSAAFPNQTTALSSHVLPEAIWLEKDGTYTRGKQSAVVPPPGEAQSYTDLLKMIAEAAGKELATKELPQRKVGTGVEKADAKALVEAALADDFRPSVQSTAARFSDGSLTDKMSWYVHTRERVQ
jgi:predicted molibdopterin-dependent oxidoreductase YjgC